MADPLNYATPGTTKPNQLPRIGGLLGTVGTFIGTGIFVLGCFGFGAAFYLSPLPMVLGVIGLVLTLTAWCSKRVVAGEDIHVVGAILVNVAVIVGALLEIMIMMNKSFFAGGGGM
jgi:hypothetical protein